MKKDIHPKTVPGQLKCACGNREEILGTKTLIEVEVCHKCHPLFVGTEEKRAVIGQVEKFHKRFGKNPKLKIQNKP